MPVVSIMKRRLRSKKPFEEVADYQRTFKQVDIASMMKQYETKQREKKMLAFEMPKPTYKPDNDATNAHRLAYFAKEAYARQGVRQNIGEWTYDHDSSTDRLGVWNNMAGDTSIMSIRGTDPSGLLSMNEEDRKRSMRDLYDDAHLAVGKQNSHMNQVKEDVRNVFRRNKEANSQHKFQITGHSLGGHMARSVMLDNELGPQIDTAHLFAPGHNIIGNIKADEGLNEYGGHELKHKMHVHVSSNDIVSGKYATQRGQVGRIVDHDSSDKNKLAAHSMWDDWKNADHWKGKYNQESEFRKTAEDHDTHSKDVAYHYTPHGPLDENDSVVTKIMGQPIYESHVSSLNDDQYRMMRGDIVKHKTPLQYILGTETGDDDGNIKDFIKQLIIERGIAGELLPELGGVLGEEIGGMVGANRATAGQIGKSGTLLGADMTARMLQDWLKKIKRDPWLEFWNWVRDAGVGTFEANMVAAAALNPIIYINWRVNMESAKILSRQDWTSNMPSWMAPGWSAPVFDNLPKSPMNYLWDAASWFMKNPYQHHYEDEAAAAAPEVTDEGLGAQSKKLHLPVPGSGDTPSGPSGPEP